MSLPARPPLAADDPLARALVAAIRAGDLPALEALLVREPWLARARVAGPDGMPRSLVHLATDWPGHFPNVAATLRALVAAGADVNARMPPHPKDPNCVETPLHAAASSNDLAAIDALLDLGADLEAPGAIFTAGTPLSDAVIFANYPAARLLVARGARLTFWQAAALGHLDLVQAHWTQSPPPAPDDATHALWHACRAGQSKIAEFLLTCWAGRKSYRFDGVEQ